MRLHCHYSFLSGCVVATRRRSVLIKSINQRVQNRRDPGKQNKNQEQVGSQTQTKTGVGMRYELELTIEQGRTGSARFYRPENSRHERQEIMIAETWLFHSQKKKLESPVKDR